MMGPCGGVSAPAEVPAEPLGNSAGVAAEREQEEQGAETQPRRGPRRSHGGCRVVSLPLPVVPAVQPVSAEGLHPAEHGPRAI